MGHRYTVRGSGCKQGQQSRPATGDRSRAGFTSSCGDLSFQHSAVLLPLQGLPMGEFMGVEASEVTWARGVHVQSWWT